MKRFISILLISVCIFTLLGCSKKETIRQPVEFYYCNETIAYNDAAGVIASETRERQGYENDLVSLMNLYLSGPIHEGYTSPFPTGVKVVDISVDEAVVTIVLSNSFSDLTGHQLTLACACLTKTLIGITTCSSVQISAQDTMLDGKEYILMDENSILLLDQFIPPTEH